MKFQSPNLMKDTLENCCRDNISSEYLGKLNPAQAYARGIINGMVTTIMAIRGCEFMTALSVVKELTRKDSGCNGPFVLSSVPEEWRDDWYLADS
jgi:hypothetical protein